MKLASSVHASISMACVLALAACGGGGDDGVTPAGTARYQVGGTVSGLGTSGLVLANGSSTVSVASGATTFNFADTVASGGAYGVTVRSQPPGQTCTVYNSSGSVGSANVNNVSVNCRGYVAYTTNMNVNASSISEYSLSGSGALSLLGAGAINAGSKSPRGIVVAPNGRFAYVANSNSAAGAQGNSISQFTVNPDGSLAALGSPVATGNEPIDLAITPDGRFVYAVNFNDNTLSQYTVGADGQLSAMSPVQVATGIGPSAIAITPDGLHAYVANYSGGTVGVYDIASNGALTLATTVSLAGGPRQIAITRDGSYAYVTLAVQGKVAQFAIVANGALAPLTTATVPAGMYPYGITTTADGKFVYVANLNGNNISQYRVGTDGGLTALTPATLSSGVGGAAGASPHGMSFTPDGKFLYVSNLGNSAISQFSVGTDGTLTGVASTLLTSAAASPWALLVH